MVRNIIGVKVIEPNLEPIYRISNHIYIITDNFPFLVPPTHIGFIFLEKFKYPGIEEILKEGKKFVEDLVKEEIIYHGREEIHPTNLHELESILTRNNTLSKALQSSSPVLKKWFEIKWNERGDFRDTPIIGNNYLGVSLVLLPSDEFELENEGEILDLAANLDYGAILDEPTTNIDGNIIVGGTQWSVSIKYLGEGIVSKKILEVLIDQEVYSSSGLQVNYSPTKLPIYPQLNCILDLCCEAGERYSYLPDGTSKIIYSELLSILRIAPYDSLIYQEIKEEENKRLTIYQHPNPKISKPRGHLKLLN